MRNNPIPFVIPCHRVVAAGDKIGGYGGGRNAVALKRELLAKGSTLSALTRAFRVSGSATGFDTSLKKSLPLSSTTTNAGKSSHLDLPHRFHAELGVLEHLDLGDAVLGEPGRGPADRAEVEAAVRLARVGDGLRAVALGEHHERAAVAPGTGRRRSPCARRSSGPNEPDA